MEFLADVFGALFSAYVLVVIVASVYFWAKKTNRSQAPIVRRLIGFGYGLSWPVLLIRYLLGRQQARADEVQRQAAERRILGKDTL